MVIGDFNAFEFTDGYVDVAGIIKGDFDGPDASGNSFDDLGAAVLLNTDKLNETGQIKELPVIIVSSAGSEPRVQRLKELGVRDYIQKPFVPEQIRESPHNGEP